METVFNTLTRWIVLAALMLAYGPFGQLAHAFQFKKALYAASFSWKGAGYHFEVGTTPLPERAPMGTSRFVALITAADGTTVATCRRMMMSEFPLDTDSMTLRCEGAMFSPAAATARFKFAPSLKHPTLTLWAGPRGMGTEIALMADASPAPTIAMKQ